MKRASLTFSALLPGVGETISGPSSSVHQIGMTEALHVILRLPDVAALTRPRAIEPEILSGHRMILEASWHKRMKADRRGRSSAAKSVEMGFSVVTLRTNQDTMVVATQEAPFIGVSGRQIAVAEYGTEVTKLGERGPYTIVHWHGRDGYLLTEQLLSDVEFESAAAAAAAAEEAAELKAPAKRFRFGFPWLQRVA